EEKVKIMHVPLPLNLGLQNRWAGMRDRCILLAVCIVGCAYLISAAWMGDDAYITFRVVANAVHGYGLRWNVHERVQAYSNPLWMLVHIPFYLVWRNMFYLSYTLSFLCAVGSVIITARTFAKSALTIAFFLIIPLLMARPWVEYAMSGLENPMSYLLFAIFG